MLEALAFVADENGEVAWVAFERRLSEVRREQKGLPVVWAEPREELVAGGYVVKEAGHTVTPDGFRYVEYGGRIGLAALAASRPAPRFRPSLLAERLFR